MLNRDISINEIIEKYPTVKDFLLMNDVDCMNCSVKTCLLKDILEYHNFSKTDQEEMYIIIDQLVDGKVVEMKKFTANVIESEYSLIIQTLINEHVNIKELIYVFKYISSKKDFLNTYSSELASVLKYLAQYADSFHHQKEEDLLFCMFREKEIVEAMYEEHELGRKLRKAVVDSKSSEEAKIYIEQFCDMLDNHIHKEDNVLFPYLDRNLSDDVVKRLNDELKNYDNDLEEEVKNFLIIFNEKEFNL